MGKNICGIQQVGIGTNDLQRDWKWYRRNFGMNIRIFEDAAEAPLMVNYTGGEVQKRVAALAMNMRGGGGFEIWQYTSRRAQPANFSPEIGDLGFLAVKMKTDKAITAFELLKKQGAKAMTSPAKSPTGDGHFYVSDLNGYWFDIVESQNWFKKEDTATGGVYGVVIGVSNMEKSMAFYGDLLGFDHVLADETGMANDLSGLPGSNTPVRRVILGSTDNAIGPFNPLLGANQIELIQAIDKKGRKIFENRYWGDLGFIHLCFDVRNMDELKRRASDLGHPFTVDSANSFDMGKAAGRFAYVEDPDGALIEFVETHKLPIVEKWGWYIDLRKRNPNKSLPTWLINCFRFNKVKG